jgi:hypothetical protein
MKTGIVRKPLGTAAFEKIRAVRFLSWEDVLEVEFDSGVSYLVSNRELRKKNRLNTRATPAVAATWIDPELRSGFFVRYENGEIAEASWEFVKEHP